MTEQTPTRTPTIPSTFGGRRHDTLTVAGEQRLARRIELAFAPLHKAALGLATGIAFGGTVAAATLLDLILDPGRQVPLTLLSQYFYGYRVSLLGALIGGIWGLLVGFVAGWFIAFARNAAMALWVIYFRSRAELQHTHDFLDYI